MYMCTNRVCPSKGLRGKVYELITQGNSHIPYGPPDLVYFVLCTYIGHLVGSFDQPDVWPFVF